jgi:hypothetical protein
MSSSLRSGLQTGSGTGVCSSFLDALPQFDRSAVVPSILSAFSALGRSEDLCFMLAETPSIQTGRVVQFLPGPAKARGSRLPESE